MEKGVMYIIPKLNALHVTALHRQPYHLAVARDGLFHWLWGLRAG